MIHTITHDQKSCLVLRYAYNQSQLPWFLELYGSQSAVTGLWADVVAYHGHPLTVKRSGEKDLRLYTPKGNPYFTYRSHRKRGVWQVILLHQDCTNGASGDVRGIVDPWGDGDVDAEQPPASFIARAKAFLPFPLLADWALPLWQQAKESKLVGTINTFNCAAWGLRLGEKDLEGWGACITALVREGAASLP
jgi:hypothetical protein